MPLTDDLSGRFLRHLPSDVGKLNLTPVFEALGQSQTAVAAALGWSEQKLSAAESGARRLDVLEFIELAGVLQISPTSAFGLAARQVRASRKVRSS